MYKEERGVLEEMRKMDEYDMEKFIQYTTWYQVPVDNSEKTIVIPVSYTHLTLPTICSV